jgi:hypothetical protein
MHLIPSFRTTNMILTVVWAIMLPISIKTGWIYSVAFISFVSIYANFVSHLAAWRADVPNDDPIQSDIHEKVSRIDEKAGG